MTSGYNGASPCEKGLYLDVKKETSHNATLNDRFHDSTIYRLYNDYLIHQGNNRYNINTSNTEGCVGVSGDCGKNLKQNYTNVKKKIGGTNAIVVVR